MRLKSEFLQLSCQFDNEALQKDISMLPENAWRLHPQGFKGNSAVSLIARNGISTDDRTFGPMMPTEWLAQLPYVQKVLASFRVPLGRCRLMRIKCGFNVPPHTDLDYYWQRRMRVHIPIVTNEDVLFKCGDVAIHMAEGHTWIFDTTQLHRVINPNGSERIHLVFDTVGSEYMFGLFTKNNQVPVQESIPNQSLASVKPVNRNLYFESHNRPSVMSPHEQREILVELLNLFSTELDAVVVELVHSMLQPVMQEWNATWAEHGTERSGIDTYQQLLLRLSDIISNCALNVQFRGSPVEHWLKHWLVEPALDLDILHKETTYINFINPETTPENSYLTQTNTDAINLNFGSQYTESLTALIAHLGGSLAVTTYASNRLVLLRSDGIEMNTHFKEYTAIMGLAYDGTQLALGAKNSIWLFRSQPDLKPKIHPNCDAVFVPTKRHMTGDIRIHELNWSDDELWFVNTRFSCLATLDENHSFIPRWHPHFINKLSAEDACHLNGMAMHDGKPAWVTALGASSTPGGWRDNKNNGGVIIDVSSGEIATSDLCMPHSPRWHGDNLWFLDSGRGELCQLDPNNGEKLTIARFPGFARGLAMVDRYAFVGCSRIRETSWFGGLPIQEQNKPLECGIWAVDIVAGKIIGWLKFDEGIDEIFDLQWLPQLQWPEILEPDETTSCNGFSIPAEKIFHFK